MSSDSGKWLPYNLDGTAHECRNNSTSKKDKSKEQDQHKQNYQSE